MGPEAEKGVVYLQEIIKQDYIGNPAQLVTLRRVKVAEGRAKGTEIIEVRTAGGLALELGKQRATMTARQAGRLLNRLERFRSFAHYLDAYPEWKRQVSFHVFEGIAHKETLCYPDPVVLDFVFNG